MRWRWLCLLSDLLTLFTVSHVVHRFSFYSMLTSLDFERTLYFDVTLTLSSLTVNPHLQIPRRPISFSSYLSEIFGIDSCLPSPLLLLCPRWAPHAPRFSPLSLADEVTRFLFSWDIFSVGSALEFLVLKPWPKLWGAFLTHLIFDPGFPLFFPFFLTCRFRSSLLTPFLILSFAYLRLYSPFFQLRFLISGLVRFALRCP